MAQKQAALTLGKGKGKDVGRSADVAGWTVPTVLKVSQKKLKFNKDLKKRILMANKLKIKAKSNLEKFVAAMTYGLKDQFLPKHKSKIESAIRETLDWLATSQLAQEGEFQRKQLNLATFVYELGYVGMQDHLIYAHSHRF